MGSEGFSPSENSICFTSGSIQHEREEEGQLKGESIIRYHFPSATEWKKSNKTCAKWVLGLQQNHVPLSASAGRQAFSVEVRKWQVWYSSDSTPRLLTTRTFKFAPSM
uniref:Uncharacterized protein n=1 Tax=Solanum tuberosum TaxID=4113 RepID=M0ZJJ2_SOLTU